ncbi:MAG: hypothetical protein M0T77_01310 [Actinomycetota bacterium]|nr:hypothetical protein [Actinomycetota bacterium]
MLFAINFQDDVQAFPPPILELTGTVTGGLFDRAQSKFEALWQQAGEDPLTHLRTQAQLDQKLSQTDARDAHAPAWQRRPAGESYAAPPSPATQTREPPGPPPRRWPGRRQ